MENTAGENGVFVECYCPRAGSKGSNQAVEAALTGTVSPGLRMWQLTAETHCGFRIDQAASLPALITGSKAKSLINLDGSLSNNWVLGYFARLGLRLSSSKGSATN